MYLTGFRRQLAFLATLGVPQMRTLPVTTLLALRKSLRDEKLTRLANGQTVINSFMPPFPSPAFGTLVDGLHLLRKGRAVPISTYLAVTHRCRYRCWHCSHAFRKHGPELDATVLRNVISDLQDLGVSMIGFTGGEPLLREDLEDILRSIDQRSCTLLFTSGDGLTAERAMRLRDAGLFGVAVSLDHYQPRVHDERRGVAGAFDTAMAAIERSLEQGFYTMIQLVATRDVLDADSMENYLRLARGLGVHEIRLLEPMPTGRLLRGDGACCLSPGEREALRALHTRTNRDRTAPKVCAFAHLEHADRYGCGAGFQHMYIDADGHVCPCDFVPVSFGNVTREKVVDVWRRMARELGEPRPRCFLMEKGAALREAFDGSLPLDWRDLREHCTLCHKGELPGYYRALGWGKRTAKCSTEPCPTEQCTGVAHLGLGS